jgi:hypothetical protein
MAYLSQSTFEQLMQQGIHLITKLKFNMKNTLIVMTDKLLLRKRSIIETIHDQLKIFLRLSIHAIVARLTFPSTGSPV